jgi:replicative DNA helicase
VSDSGQQDPEKNIHTLFSNASQAGVRQAPSNELAEQTVLGSLMVRPELLPHIVDILKPEDFYISAHGRIYAECRRRIQDSGGLPGSANPVVLSAWWAKDPEGEKHKQVYLDTLARAAIPVPDFLISNADAIVECAKWREVLAGCEQCTEAGYNQSTDLVSATEKLRQKLDNIVGPMTGQLSVVVDDALRDGIQRMEESKALGGHGGVKTGFPRVDKMLALLPATMNILAGRPGSGKTSLAMQCGVNAACELRDARILEPDLPGVVVIVSLEMEVVPLAQRMLSWLSGVPLEAIRNGTYNDMQEEMVREAQQQLAGVPLEIVKAAGMSPAHIRHRLRQIKQRSGDKITLCIIDHLHLINRSEYRTNSDSTALGRVADEMQRLCKELEFPLLLLSQMNRAMAARDDKRPEITDLRGAGEIEQNADTVGFVHRPEMFIGKSEPIRNAGETDEHLAERIQAWRKQREEWANRAELIFEKSRDGDTGVINMLFRGETLSFSEDPARE